MTTVREIMTGGAECAHTEESLVDVARKMRDLGVGSLPICGQDHRLHGMVTDRDIVVRVVADGDDPTVLRVSEFATEKPVTVGADDSLEEAIQTMSDHEVRRLPVIDGHDLIGVLSQADIAQHCPDDQVANLVAMVSSAPGNN